MRKTIATLLVPLALLGACSPSEAAPPEVLVFAAASLRDALGEAAPRFEARHGARLMFSFGASGDLARQILAADRADAFVSADELEADRLEAAGRLQPGMRRVLGSNALVVVVPAGEPERPFEPADLARLDRVAIGNPATVPAGRYARAWLEALGLWDEVEPRLVPALDVRAALAVVEAGGAGAAIVYRSDAARSSRVRVVHAATGAAAPRIAYPGAGVRGGAQPRLGAAFVDFLGEAESQALFARHGFGPAGEPR